MSDITEMIPQRVRDVELYDPKRAPITHDLSDNTSQWGVAPAVRDALTAAAMGKVNISRYPDIYAAAFKEELLNVYGEYLPQGTSQITVGNGTDDVLDAAIRALTNEGDLVLMPMPSFPMPGYFARMNGRNIVGTQLLKDGSIDVDDVVMHNPTIMYVCSPNNPTGIEVPRSNMDELLERYDGFVIIDEAYAEFSDNHLLDLLVHPRVIITRTMSKIHALAGLRIGFALGDAEVISSIEAVRGPFKANALGLEAAQAALSAAGWVDFVREEVKSIRNWFVSQLTALGYTPIESETNFVYVPGLPEKQYREKFTELGYAVRWFDDLPVIGSGARITLAPRDVLEPLITALKENS